MDKVTLCLTTYNRYEILKESLSSLAETKFPVNCQLIIKDDCSTDCRVKQLLDNYSPGIPVQVIYNEKNLGCDLNVISSIENAFNNTKDNYVMVLDSDAYYHPEWLEKTLDMISVIGDLGMGTTFNTPKHPVQYEKDGYAFKKSMGGFCVALRREIFDMLPREIEWDWKANYICNKTGFKIATTLDSYIEHIGVIGTHCKPGDGKIADKALNFLGDKEASEKLRTEKKKKRY